MRRLEASRPQKWYHVTILRLCLYFFFHYPSTTKYNTTCLFPCHIPSGFPWMTACWSTVKNIARGFMQRNIFQAVLNRVTPLSTTWMRRFSEVLLLVSFTLRVLPLFVNGFDGLRPTFNFEPVRRNAEIRGLLIPRQSCSSGFAVCGVTGCCPVGWGCCSQFGGNCCDPT